MNFSIVSKMNSRHAITTTILMLIWRVLSTAAFMDIHCSWTLFLKVHCSFSGNGPRRDPDLYGLGLTVAQV